MLKEQYNKNRPRKECPICGAFITNACFDRHYQACVNPSSKYNLRKNKMTNRLAFSVDCDDLHCVFCSREFQSKVARAQHEIRCKENPNRRDCEALATYIRVHRKGKTAENCLEIAKQRQTMLDKYAGDYVSPVLGKPRKVCSIYKDHNDQEIDKWLKYLHELNFKIPEIETVSTGEGYSIVSRHQVKEGNTIRLTYTHDYIANILLQGNLQMTNTVHHIDKNRANNDPFNLLVFDNKGSHNRFHTSNFAFLTYNVDTHLFSCELKKI